MRALIANGVTLHAREDGDPNGAPALFANSLGTDLRLWYAVIPLLREGLRLIRYDKRGHGLSDCPDGQYSIDDQAADAAALMPDAHVHVTDGAGHLPCVENPTGDATVLNPFLKEHAYA